MLKQSIFLIIGLALAQPAFSTTYEGKLIGGGGIDDLSLVIKTTKGKTVGGYCKTVSVCDDWDALFDSDHNAISSLKPIYKGRKVRVTIIQRRNQGDIAGPSDDEILPFITQFKFLN